MPTQRSQPQGKHRSLGPKGPGALVAMLLCAGWVGFWASGAPRPLANNPPVPSPAATQTGAADASVVRRPVDLLAVDGPRLAAVHQAVEWREAPLAHSVTPVVSDRYLVAQAPLTPEYLPREPLPPPVPSPPTPANGSPTTNEPPRQVLLPIDQAGAINGSVEATGELVSVAVREAPLHSVLSLLAQQQGLSIVASSSLTQPVTVTLQPTSLENALDALLAVAGCTWTSRNGVIYVTAMTKEGSSSPFFQGREVRLFSLNYASAEDVEKVVAGLLSPVGKVFIRQVSPTDKLRTVEQVVVEDLPPFIERIADYIAQADQMPRQVMIEAHILQVRLGKDKAHGVNFDALTRLSGAKVQLWSKGLASEDGPGMVFTVDGTDFNSVIDCITNTTDAKTLASPKTLVINGQESKIQIGSRLGYFVTTTTQTSTLQDVQFLEVGVVLHVTPMITADGQVLMQVAPKVSSGDINPVTTLPEEETTEVDTSVLVPDGHGIIIGGLIQEFNTERQSKLGWAGDLWGIGRLFQRRSVDRERNEVIVALLPRIVPCGSCEEATEYDRATTPLLEPHLAPAYRPWEPALPDATHRPLWAIKSAPAAAHNEAGECTEVVAEPVVAEPVVAEPLGMQPTVVEQPSESLEVLRLPAIN
ncbi:Type IV pilus biogenesis and competence protein PilQ precursor [Posidoniimonas polymericola]|uniref:Type IV pilus biogenesis and competence protein PilQ n=1 Tax=Posidoniimonas polymericola TaxID=2528002 RepID=A0A5C5YMR3_9BACT|nr:hypothetical protein [Posidoniimonas polymericola]TWT76130.1 Type IV pilus biogenesis and competence protein PilQ precursor [Posidoniimonas polymericola]